MKFGRIVVAALVLGLAGYAFAQQQTSQGKKTDTEQKAEVKKTEASTRGKMKGAKTEGAKMECSTADSTKVKEEKGCCAK